ncbi:flagellar biosynthesis regulator FlaF [Thioclava sp. FR2]|uniref:flagellar biosynthesis regulator FlaF n=1 Tax=Thioclava sp. FR2 TaxID=3445780 RepID=UPI003EBE39DC
MGYAPNDAALRPLRAIEYDAFARVTRRLSQTWAGRKSDYPALAKSLNDNLSLWRILAMDVAEASNSLPQSLRAQLFYLFEFTDLHSGRILRGEGSVEVLVDVNMAVMRGLRGEGEPV